MKQIRNILLLYICFNLFGANFVSYICKIQDSVSSMNMSEEEDDSVPESKEDCSKEEEKLQCEIFQLSPEISEVIKAKLSHYSDRKIENYSKEILCPPPNC